MKATKTTDPMPCAPRDLAAHYRAVRQRILAAGIGPEPPEPLHPNAVTEETFEAPKKLVKFSKAPPVMMVEEERPQWMHPRYWRVALRIARDYRVTVAAILGARKSDVLVQPRCELTFEVYRVCRSYHHTARMLKAEVRVVRDRVRDHAKRLGVQVPEPHYIKGANRGDR